MAQGIKKGDVLKSRYEILSPIGKGGMSRVFLASDRDVHNRQVAIKEVSRHAKDPAGRPIEQSLARESKIMSKLSHPKIVDILDTVTTDDFIYIVMDHVPGESLDKVVRRNGPQSEEDVQGWMLEICDVLKYLHNQDPPIIYRDMKPNNIMLHPDGYVKLIDFNVVREYKDEADVNQDTIAFGTKGYAPPEQYGKSQTDARSDIYAIGTTMWHLLAGEAPPMEFPLRNVREKNPNVGQGFADVIIPKCTALQPDDRYQSCEELAEALEMYQELTLEYRQKQVNKVRAFAVSGVLAIVLALSGVGLLGAREATVAEKYESYLALGNDKMQTDTEAAEEDFLSAIDKRPDGIDAYEGLIASYKVDDKFDVDEKRQFDNVYQSNLSTLQSSSRFAELSYEIGRLYWTYYAYGQSEDSEDLDENRANRIKASAEYFSNAVKDPNFENHDRASIYDGIAQFTTNITNSQREGSDDELYADYWEQLKALTDRIPSETSDMIRLDSCALIVNALETYLDKFYDVVDVPEEDVESMVKTIQQELGEEIRSNDELESQRKETLDRLNNKVKRKITTVYSNAAVGN